MPSFVWKAAVSVAVFALIFSRIDIGAVGHAIGAANASFLGLAFLLSLAMVLTDALLWKSVLRSFGHEISLRPALLYAIVGCFFASLGPSAMGADFFRAAQMRRLGVPIEGAIRAVVVTRLASFAPLLILIAAGIPVAWSYALSDGYKGAFLIAFGVSCAIFVVLLAFRVIARRIGVLGRLPFAAKLISLSNEISATLTNPRTAPMTLASSTLMHLIRISIFAAIAAALHVNVPFSALFAFVPAAMLIAMVPISFGSWGVREASLIYFLAWAGVPAEAALSLSLVFGFTRLVLGVMGGIAWMLARSGHYRLKVADAPN